MYMCTIKKANSTVNVALARFLWLKIEENYEFRLFHSIGTIDILFRYRKQKVTVENFRFVFSSFLTLCNIGRSFKNATSIFSILSQQFLPSETQIFILTANYTHRYAEVVFN